MRTLLYALSLFVLCVFALACEQPGGDANAVVDECTKSGQRCRIDAGKLGVCIQDLGASRDNPTFTCQSQH